VSLPLVTSPLLGSVSGLHHAFTTRVGGVSRGPFATLNLGLATSDDDDLVTENHRILAAHFGRPPEAMFGARQVHGTGVVRVGDEDISRDVGAKTGDILITARSGALVLVRVADCLPILLVDPDHRTVGAVHAGWRGTLAKALPAAVQAMAENFGTEAAQLLIAIGPGISVKNYEVGSGVAALFENQVRLEKGEVEERGDSVRLNLAAINARMAREAGVRSERIWVSKACTFAEAEKFFSYRRDGKRSGRMVGCIGYAA